MLPNHWTTALLRNAAFHYNKSIKYYIELQSIAESQHKQHNTLCVADGEGIALMLYPKTPQDWSLWHEYFAYGRNLVFSLQKVYGGLWATMICPMQDTHSGKTGASRHSLWQLEECGALLGIPGCANSFWIFTGHIPQQSRD